MTPEQWEQVKSVFEAARGSSDGERMALVAQLCGDDGLVCAEVRSLLASDHRVGDFLEPPRDPGTDPNTLPADGLIGRQIGGYMVTGVLGRGGMGTVYEARQAEPRRRVALKVMRSDGPMDRQSLRRFQRETLALARLNHPNIAAIYEAGHTDDSRHFFAQELVEGESLAAYAARRELSIDEKLGLFLRVCDGIAYAHQRGVIHRDLKPSNILVADGNAEAPKSLNAEAEPSIHSSLSTHRPAASATPKILDFGLARITDADISLTTVNVDAGTVQGTLAYMSPEQTHGRAEDIDQRSDIYSLGVVLYELLSGRMPYEVRGVPLPMAVRAIRDQSPLRPSSIHRILRGDLETILVKALEKDPARRYQSASALAEDIQRFQRNEPILARPPSIGYQIKKLATRHKLASAGMGLVFLFAIGFAITVSVLYQRAVGAERTASERAQTSADLSGYLLGLIEHLDPRVGENICWTTSLSVHPDRQTADLLWDLVDTRRREVRARLAETGDHLAEANQLCNLGWLLVGVQDSARARDCFRLANEIISEANDREGIDRSYALSGLAACSGSWRAFEEAADFEMAGHQIRLERLGPGDSETMRAAHGCAMRLIPLGKYAQAEALIQSAPRFYEQGWDYFRQERLAMVCALQGRYAEAVPILRRLRDEARTRFGENSTELHRTASWLCACLFWLDQTDEAERLLEGWKEDLRARPSACPFAFREIVRYFIEHGQTDRALSLFGTDVDRIVWFSNLQWRLGRIDVPGLDALVGQLAEEALQKAEQPQDAGLHFSEITGLASLVRDKDPPRALQLYGRAARMASAYPSVAPLPPALPLSWIAGVLLNNQLRFFEAEEMTRRAYELTLRALEPEHFETARTARDYGNALLFTGKFEQSEKLLREALPLETTAGLDGYSTSWCYEALGAALVLQGEHAEAEPLLRAALERRSRWLSDGADPVVRARIWLCACLFRLGSTDEAESLLEHLQSSRNHVGTAGIAMTHPNHVLALREIIRHFVDTAEPQRALELLGDNVGLAERFTRLNELLGPVNVPGFRKRFSPVLAEALTQLGEPGDHVASAKQVRSMGWIFSRMGDHERALEAFQAAAPHLPARDELGRCEQAHAHNGMVSTLQALSRFEEAAEAAGDAYRAFQQQEFAATRSDTLAAGRQYATALLYVGRAADAEHILREILPHELDLIFPESAYAAGVLERLGAALALQGRFREAAPIFRRARDQRRSLWADDSSQVESSTIWLIACLFRTGDRAAAEVLLGELERQAAARESKSIARPNAFSVLGVRTLVQYLVEKGQDDRAARYVGGDSKVGSILQRLNQQIGDINLDLQKTIESTTVGTER